MRPLFCCIATALLAGSPAEARGVQLAGSDDACPSPAAVAAALRAILPDVVVGDGLRVELRDDGNSLRVSAGETQRQFDDPQRRCSERAQKAAVFIALVLDPPNVVVPVRRKISPSIELAAAGVLDAAALEGALSGGAQLSLFVGARYLGGVIALAGLSPITLALTGARARLWRVPVEIAVRGRLRRNRWGLALDLGAVLGAQITQGLDIAASLTETRAELGIVLTARVELPATRRLVPFVALRTEIVPQPYNLVLPSAGVVGTTPQYWVGAVLGLAFVVR